MKEKNHHWLFALALVLLCLLMGLLSFNFMKAVQESLWQNSVNTILERTMRGASVLERCHLKDRDMLRVLADDLERGTSYDSLRIKEHLRSFLPQKEGLFVLLFPDGRGWTDDGHALRLSPEERERLRRLPRRGGIVVPCMTSGRGKRLLTCYTPVSFRDGPTAYLFLSIAVEAVYAETGLSFYQNKGFSYVVTPDGSIAVRPPHPAANRSASDLFDLLEEGDNDREELEHFRRDLREGKSGIALFEGREGDSVFCHVAMPQMAGCSMVSVVPDAVIMHEANTIVRQTLLLSLLGIAAALTAVAIYVYLSRTHRRKLLRLAYVDQLTGLRNFACFLKDGEKLLQCARAPESSMLFIDLINFKIFNDILNYREGDRLLQDFALILKAQAGRDALVGRLAADHFAVLLPERDRTKLTAFCRAIQQDIQDMLDVRGLHYRQEVRAGICIAAESDAALSVHSLLDRAGIALKALKMQGSGLCMFYTPAMRQRILREKELEDRMEGALYNGEYRLFIQPKFDLNEHALAGGETLVRWQRDGTLLSPDQFIPLFERNHFIIQLDRFMLEEACRLLRRWLDAGYRVPPLSVNVSRVQFFTADFVPFYLSAKKSYAIPDGLLELECTESIFFDNVESLREKLLRLKAEGFRCSIDDFGAGYSSLNMLTDLPVDTLKLDAAFFRKGKDDERARTIIRSMIKLAGELHMTTVAEGVEKPEQVEFLEKVGCSLVQGYVFGRPMPAAEFEALILRENSFGEQKAPVPEGTEAPFSAVSPRC